MSQQPPTSSLTLLEAVERALEQYPSIHVARAASVEAQAGLREVETTGRPRLNLRSAATQYQKETIVSPIHGFTLGATPPFDHTLFQTALDGSYTVYDGGGRTARLAQAALQVEVAESGVESTRAGVTARVVTSYARVLSQRELLDAHDRRIDALEAQRARVEQLLDVGRAARLDLLRIAAALAEASAERVRYGEALDLAERELARLMGTTPADARAARLVAFELRDLETVDRSLLADALRRANPSVEEARRRIAVADAAVAVAASERRPRLNAVGSLVDFGSAAGHFTNEWSARLQVVYPVFDGGAVRERVAKAEAARRAAAERLRLLETELETELDRALSAVREAAARRASLLSAVEQFDEVARIEQLRLDTGTGTVTDFLDAEADLLAARANLAGARYAEQTARVELARVTGELAVDWLRRHLAAIP